MIQSKSKLSPHALELMTCTRKNGLRLGLENKDHENMVLDSDLKTDHEIMVLDLVLDSDMVLDLASRTKTKTIQIRSWTLG